MHLSPARALIGSGLGLSLFFVGCGTDDPAPAASVSATSAVSASATPSSERIRRQSQGVDQPERGYSDGEYGKEPKLKLDAPWAVDKTSTKVLKPNSSGAVITPKAPQSR